MNPQSTLGGLIGGGNVTPSITPSSSTDTSALADVADVLSGGAGNQDASTLFDPTMFGGQGVFSPTGADTGNLPLSTPQIAQAQQDPSGQIKDQPAQAQDTVDRTGKGDRDTTQPETTVDRTGKGDLAAPPGTPPVGPTAPGGQQPGQKPDQTQPAVDPRAPLQPPQSPLARLAAAQKQAAAPAAAAPAAQPQPAPQEPSAAALPRPTGGGSSGGAPSGGPPGAAGPASTVGAPPMGGAGPPPGLLKAIMTLLGVPTGGGGGPQPLQNVAGQAYPQRPGGPMTPTGRLGPYGRAIARQRLFQGSDQDGGGGDLNYAGTSRVPPPGSTSEVSAPTADQVRQTRMAGTDTPPTEGFSGYLQSERARFGDELKGDKTKWETLGMIALEHGHDPAAVAESLLNRANYAKTSINNMIHSGFYGPINKGMLAREVRMLQRNPEYAAKLNAGLETAMRGSNLLGGATDQGSGRDPNVGHRGGRVIRFGETYNDWGGGPGGHDGAANYRRQQQERVRRETQEGKRGDQLAMDIHDVTSPARGEENIGNAAAPFGNNPVLDAIERMHRKRREGEQPASPETVGRKRKEGRTGEFQEARLPTAYRSGAGAAEFRELEGVRRERQGRLS